MIRRVLRAVVPVALKSWIEDQRLHRALPALAKELARRDARGLPSVDPGAERAIDGALRWLARAQDCSATNDGGVARDFSLLKGWAASYPETTGYIVPTFLDTTDTTLALEFRQRAERMLDWLVSIQLADGSFQAGTIAQTPRVPATFNTGQILIGLAAAAQHGLGPRYTQAMHHAADWLVRTQDADGCWRKHPSPYTVPGEKTYETHVSWGLFEAERAAPGHGYGDAGVRQVRWALTRQRANGWFEDCCLTHSQQPLTHTIGYALRGVAEAFRLTRDRALLDAALRTGRALTRCIDADGRLPGRLDANWNPAVNWACLTGSVQIAHSWLLLADWAGDDSLRDAAHRVNRFVRRTLILDGDPDLRGGVRGSFPVSGRYGQFEFLNWAAKFMIDANRTELSAAS